MKSDFTNLEKTIIILAMVAGLLATIGLVILENRDERYTSFFLKPGSYETHPRGQTTSFVFGAKSYERTWVRYVLQIYVGDRLTNTSFIELRPLESVEEARSVDIANVNLPVQVRLVLVSPYNKYEVHYWLKQLLPVASFEAAPTSGKEPLDVSFTDLSLNDPARWSWDFGDTSTSSLRNPVHTYTSGMYTVTLRVSNSEGSNEESKSYYIVVIPKTPPVADFTAMPRQGKEPLNVSFSDQSTNSPTAFSWDFGDGGVSSLQNPVHVFNRPGNFSVTLMVSNADGGNLSIKGNYIFVLPKVPPFADFTAYPLEGRALIDVQFTDLSNNTPNKWAWDFGDGNTSSLQNPRHTYKEGTYSIKLTVWNTDGSAEAVKEHLITILPAITPQPTL